MTTPLTILTPHNIRSVRVIDGSNSIDFSSFQNLDFRLSGPGFGIKYVISGQETYCIHGREYQVRAGQFLLVNPGSIGQGSIRSERPVRGICINIRKNMMEEVVSAARMPDEPVQGRGMDPDFRESLCHPQASHLGFQMQQLAQRITCGNGHLEGFSDGFFYRLCELYLAEYALTSRRIAAIKAVKDSTRRELYRRVQLGRNFLEDCFAGPVDIAAAARTCCLSEYQFFRLFKAIYGVSPYQWLLQRRLDFSRELLQEPDNRISDIALRSGFSDIFNFSKAFKKRFGIAPSAVKHGRNRQDLTNIGRVHPGNFVPVYSEMECIL